ncbi:site-specific recombinase [Pinibacter aurantiacus]|uniref:Site-specific recombinase n=1 Tax=Pinibacter aurantiacus TaxID=2851599 RepID=A0A9E2W8P0_9BACT|nr:site-specific recombinase [Pinibacter aurantiacus]MBV4358457.1 site-specific recombinase [Pinibacter aurantiacus]
MIFFQRTQKQETIAKKKDKAVVLPLYTGTSGLQYVVDLVKNIRPGNYRNTKEAEKKFREVLAKLREESVALFALRKALLSQFQNTDLIPTLTESGITSSRGFVQELISKLKHRILPPLPHPKDFRYVIERVFYLKNDHVWVENIDQDLWRQFFELLGIQVNITDPDIIRQLGESLQMLSYKVATLGMEKEITGRFSNVQDAIQPFIEQNRLVNLYMTQKNNFDSREKKWLFANIQENLYNCTQSLQWITDQRLEYGTSLAQTFVTVRMQQQIERMHVIIDVLDTDELFDTERFIEYFKTVVKNENTKNSLREFLSVNLGLVAYQIAEHKGKKGQKYISNSRADFRHLFNSSMAGSFIISFGAIIKNLLGLVHLPYFWQGMSYGTNYATCFVLMDQSDATLATKQPAYTASAVASSLDVKKSQSRPDLRNLALTVAKVSRSQIASFAGNLLVVFPFTYLLAWLFNLSFGFKIAAGDAAQKLLADQHPWQSMSVLWACVTGFFLFLSGIIAGYVENHVVYGNVAERLKNHPIFVNTIPAKRLDKLANFLNKNSGTLAGSISLGFFLGWAAPLGKIFGIPFDIRHITISAGNTAIGYYGLDHNVPLSYLLTVIAGVLLIGFINFLVSFSLAFFVAVKSRGIRLKDYPEFLGILRRYFFRHPKDFLLPPKKTRSLEELS